MFRLRSLTSPQRIHRKIIEVIDYYLFILTLLRMKLYDFIEGYCLLFLLSYKKLMQYSRGEQFIREMGVREDCALLLRTIDIIKMMEVDWRYIR